MENFFNKIKLIWTDTILRKRVLFVLFALVLFRLLSAIPIPGIDTLELNRFLANNQFFGILNKIDEKVGAEIAVRESNTIC